MVYARLSVMMFVQFAIWGAWAVLIAGHMANLGFSGKEIGFVFGSTAFGALLSPLIAGWVADRLMPTQFFTALCHFAGAPLLYLAWTQVSFGGLWVVMFCYALLYMPTIALTNAIAFRHMGDSDRFGNIRIWGTVGWIAIAWAMSEYLSYWEAQGTGESH